MTKLFKPQGKIPRHKRGFAHTLSFLMARIRKAGETRGFAVTRVLIHWDDIVGQGIAQIARPVDVSYGRGGMGATLTVLTTGAQAPMLEMQKEKLRDRVNGVYGYNAIAHIRITQTAPIGFAEEQVQFTPALKVKKEPDPETVTEVRSTAAGVTDDGLREALEALGQNVITKHKNPRG